jgi:hypothetical protein
VAEPVDDPDPGGVGEGGEGPIETHSELDGSVSPHSRLPVKGLTF